MLTDLPDPLPELEGLFLPNWADFADDDKAERILRAVAIALEITEAELRGLSRRRPSVSYGKNIAAYLISRTTNKTADQISQIIGLTPSFVQNIPSQFAAALRVHPSFRHVVMITMAEIALDSLPP